MKIKSLKESFTMYSISNREYENKASQLAEELIADGWRPMDSRYTGSKYYIIFAKKEGDAKALWKAVQYSNQLEPRVIDITYEQGIGREPIDDFDGLRRHLGKMLMPKKETLSDGRELDDSTDVLSESMYTPDGTIDCSIRDVIELRRMYDGLLQNGNLFVTVKKGTPERYGLEVSVNGTGRNTHINVGYTEDEVEALDFLYNGKCTFGDFSDANDQGYSDEETLAFIKKHNFDTPIQRISHEGPMSVDDFEQYVNNKNKKEGVGMNEATYPRHFKLGENDIQYVKVYNQYGYTIQEIRIDNVKKTFERGNFSIGHDKAYKNRQVYEDFIEELIEMGYKEIPSDYRCLRNKTRKGVPMTEAPVVKLSDGDLNNPDEVNFRKIIKRAQDEEDAEKAQAELDAKRAELKAQYGDILDRVADMPVDTGDNFDRLSELFEVLVPAEGKADTVAGECVRATMRLIYRYYNDGDYFFMGYGLETAAPAVSYLAHRYEDMIYDAQSIGERFATSYDNDKLDSEYEKFLRDLSEVVIEDIIEHPELLGELNEMDCRTTDAEWIEDEQPRFETDFMLGWDIEDMVEAEVVSTRDVQEYVEDCLSWDDVFNDCEVTYWGGSYVYVSELTFDGYNELTDRVRGKGLDIFWEEFINDHADELEEYRNKEDEPDDEEIDESLKLTEARAVEDSVWKKFVAGRKTIKEDISDDIDEEDVDKPFTYEQTEAALREITHNFTDASGEVKCFFRQEKDDGRDILKHYYRVVEVSDGRHSENEPMCYVIAYAERDE